MTATEKAIRAAHAAGAAQGIDPSAPWHHWDTAAECVAYNNGRSGVGIGPMVSAWRFGAAPASASSHNFADDRTERGVSVVAIEIAGQPRGWWPNGYGPDAYGRWDGDDLDVPAHARREHCPSAIWFSDRALMKIVGVLVLARGADGEHLIIPAEVA